jgi:hypothetical protein
MNDWSIRKLAIVESDDTEDHYERNGLNFLFYWKAKFPKFKISLFTIPNKTSREMISLLERHSDWIEILVHGFNHSSNFECFDWDIEKTKELMMSMEKRGFKKIFKAPGWTITPDLCGYPARDDQLISKDKQGVYKGLDELDFVIADRHYNKERRLENGKYICIDCQPNIVHFHTWDMPRGSELNGYRQVEEIRGIPWDHDTEFKFMSEAWEEGLYESCQN